MILNYALNITLAVKQINNVNLGRKLNNFFIPDDVFNLTVSRKSWL